MNDYSNSLYHHGIKGMHWGIRRTPAQLGHKTNAKKRKYDTSTTEGREALIRSGNKKEIKRNAKALSDNELRRAVDRIDMTKRLSSLPKEYRTRSFLRLSKNATSILGTAVAAMKIKDLVNNWLPEDIKSYLKNQIFHSQCQHSLYHHGIKGMHWGIRRSPEQLGSKNNKDKQTNKNKPSSKYQQMIDKMYERYSGPKGKAKFVADTIVIPLVLDGISSIAMRYVKDKYDISSAEDIIDIISKNKR